MRVQAMLVILSQLTVLGYAVWAVHSRIDRRKVPENLRSGLHILAAFSAGVLALAVVLNGLSDGRKFLAVREIFEIGFVCATGAVIVALRILKGAPYDRR